MEKTLYTSTCTRTCMVTKTLTITEDAYNILSQKKGREESFSEEIMRLFGTKKRKSLKEYFGILSKKEGEEMIADLEKIRKMNIKLLREKIKNESC